jgi:hypothetical protein
VPGGTALLLLRDCHGGLFNPRRRSAPLAALAAALGLRDGFAVEGGGVKSRPIMTPPPTARNALYLLHNY